MAICILFKVMKLEVIPIPKRGRNRYNPGDTAVLVFKKLPDGTKIKTSQNDIVA